MDGNYGIVTGRGAAIEARLRELGAQRPQVREHDTAAQRASIERELPQGGEAGILTIGP